MTGIYIQQLLTLLKRLLVCYLAYFLCRLLFYAANTSYFPDVSIGSLLPDCIYGLRFDTFSIVIGSSLFILLSIIPAFFTEKPLYQKIVQYAFIIPNAVFLVFNCIDVAYFPYTKKRSGIDLFKMIGGQSDLGKLIPQFIADFWWIILAYIAIIWLMAFLYRRIKAAPAVSYSSFSIRQFLPVAFLFLLCIGLCVLGVRGGLQRIPVDIVNAGAMSDPEEAPIILNTPFSIIKSAKQQVLEELDFYSETEIKQLYDPVHRFKDTVFSKENVVVLILESFSKEYTKLNHPNGGSITPFLDSLMDHSLLCTNGFANGTRSIEGIPAILSSLPSLMDNPFINSIYANNTQTSFASLLNKEGYETAFFHGGINGTMNFNSWAALAGYQHYYGKDEYNNNADFDGYWGIWDEPFLQYSVKKMSGFKAPFHAAIFTLSSHHPYFVPKKYEGRFPKTDLQNAESIGYADHALRLFFEAASKTAWFKNTLFILSADHTGISKHPFYTTVVGSLSIPVLFYRPDNSLTGKYPHAFSQIGILPSAMNLMGYSKPFFAFGQSLLSGKSDPAYFYSQGINYLCTDSMLYLFDRIAIRDVYNYKRDSLLYGHLGGKYPSLDFEAVQNYHAFIQTYHHRLIQNSATAQ